MGLPITAGVKFESSTNPKVEQFIRICEDHRMPYLNWKEDSLHLETLALENSIPNSAHQLKIKLNAAQVKSLSEQLEEIYLSDAVELRLSLPKGWTIFWKRREEGNRSLLAHPEAEEWVS